MKFSCTVFVLTNLQPDNITWQTCLSGQPVYNIIGCICRDLVVDPVVAHVAGPGPHVAVGAADPLDLQPDAAGPQDKPDEDLLLRNCKYIGRVYFLRPGF